MMTFKEIEDKIAQVEIDKGKVIGVDISGMVMYGPPLKMGHVRIVVDVKVPKYEEYDAAKVVIEDRIEEVVGTRPEHVMDDGHLIHWTIPRSALS